MYILISQCCMWYIMRKMRNDLYSYLVEDLCFFINITINRLEHSFRHQYTLRLLRTMATSHWRTLSSRSHTSFPNYANTLHESKQKKFMIWRKERKQCSVPIPSKFTCFQWKQSSIHHVLDPLLRWFDFRIENQFVQSNTKMFYL